MGGNSEIYEPPHPGISDHCHDPLMEKEFAGNPTWEL
jgi:hypothetical protein